MKYLHFFLLATLPLLAFSREQGAAVPVALRAAHAIGMIANDRRPVSLSVYFKNVSDRTIRFPIDFDGYIFKEDGRIGLSLYIPWISNPLKMDVVVSPRDFQLVDIPPGKSLLINLRRDTEIGPKSRFWVRLVIPEKVGKEFGIGELSLECESKYYE